MGTNNPSASVTVNVPTGSSFAVNHTFRPDRYAMMYHPGHRVPRPHHHTAPFASFARSLDGAYDARGLPPKLRAAVAALLAVDAAGRDAAFPAAPVPWTPPPNHIVAESAEAFCWDAW